MKKKKLIIIIFIIILFISISFEWIFLVFNKKHPETSNNYQVEEIIDETPKEEIKQEEAEEQVEEIEKEEETETETPKPDSSENKEESKEEIVEEQPKEEIPKEEPKEEVVETQELKNDKRRKELENNYGITILYGNEIGDYKPRLLTPTPMTDPTVIAEYLEKIEYTLKFYPKGFFKDFVKEEMHLKLILIDSVENDGFAGLTDKEFYTDIKITITSKGIFNYVLNHEIMHYIDAYLTIKMYPNSISSDWELLNPTNYQYGSFITEYNYNMLNNPTGAYFIENYAQTNVAEDRAKTFEYMMSRAYAPTGCFEEGETIRKKAELIANQIETYFPSVSSSVTEHWERFIK